MWLIPLMDDHHCGYMINCWKKKNPRCALAEWQIIKPPPNWVKETTSGYHGSFGTNYIIFRNAEFFQIYLSEKGKNCVK
jgi:hypothetical protein